MQKRRATEKPGPESRTLKAQPMQCLGRATHTKGCDLYTPRELCRHLGGEGGRKEWSGEERREEGKRRKGGRERNI